MPSANSITKEDRLKAAKLSKAYRKKRDINQTELSKKLDCYPWQVSNLERMIRVPGTIIRRALKLLPETN